MSMENVSLYRMRRITLLNRSIGEHTILNLPPSERVYRPQMMYQWLPSCWGMSSLLLFSSHGSSVKWVKAVQSWRKEGDDGELTNAGSDLSAECWPVDPAARKKKVTPLALYQFCRLQAFFFYFRTAVRSSPSIRITKATIQSAIFILSGANNFYGHCFPWNYGICSHDLLLQGPLLSRRHPLHTRSKDSKGDTVHATDVCIIFRHCMLWHTVMTAAFVFFRRG